LCSVRTLLSEARLGGLERLDALAVIGHALGRTRSWLIAHDDAPVNELGAATCRELLSRRMMGEPLAYLLEEKEFHGLRLRVTPAVLIPRPDTETLVDWALELLSGPLAGIDAPRVLDLGTGSGAIALAIKHRCPRVRMTAYDESAAALEIAQANAVELGLDIEFKTSDWWSAAGGCEFDLVVSNPPYIAEGDIHLDNLLHEPVAALVAGEKGMEDLRKIIVQAHLHLGKAGWVLLEHGYDQGALVRDLLSDSPWQGVSTRRDLGGNERCTGARVLTA
jgi:release factor glutamine methyltransferase